jgi:hypothetical protein
LRNTILRSIHHPFFYGVTGAFQFVHHSAEDEHVLVQGHVGDVLHQHRGGLGDHDDLEVGPPQVTAFFRRIVEAIENAVPNLAAPCP